MSNESCENPVDEQVVSDIDRMESTLARLGDKELMPDTEQRLGLLGQVCLRYAQTVEVTSHNDAEPQFVKTNALPQTHKAEEFAVVFQPESEDDLSRVGRIIEPSRLAEEALAKLTETVRVACTADEPGDPVRYGEFTDDGYFIPPDRLPNIPALIDTWREAQKVIASLKEGWPETYKICDPSGSVSGKLDDMLASFKEEEEAIRTSGSIAKQAARAVLDYVYHTRTTEDSVVDRKAAAIVSAAIDKSTKQLEGEMVKLVKQNEQLYLRARNLSYQLGWHKSLVCALRRLIQESEAQLFETKKLYKGLGRKPETRPRLAEMQSAIGEALAVLAPFGEGETTEWTPRTESQQGSVVQNAAAEINWIDRQYGTHDEAWWVRIRAAVAESNAEARRPLAEMLQEVREVMQRAEFAIRHVTCQGLEMKKRLKKVYDWLGDAEESLGKTAKKVEAVLTAFRREGKL